MLTIKKFTKKQKQICKDLIDVIIENPNYLVFDCIHNLYLDYENEGQGIDNEEYLKTIKCFLEKLKLENYDEILNIRLFS